MTIGNSVTSIDEGAFAGCSGLTEIIIPNSVKSIGKDAFWECSGLESITIGSGVKSIGYSAFGKCSNLTAVHINDIEAWCNIKYTNGISFLGSGATSDTCYPMYYADHLFLDDKEIKDLVLPNGLTSIAQGVFYGCSEITSITIPNSVTSIGEGAFSCCSGLTSVTIPNSVKTIGKLAFYNCKGLTSVTIGSSVNTINSKAFANCSELTDVYCYAENVPSTSSDALTDSYTEYATLYVPESSGATYNTAVPWSGFGTIKTLSGEIPVVEKCATPTISYFDGKLHFSCETESVEYVYNITPPSAKSGNGTDISMPTTYKVTVYATKDGYENSDVATKVINVSGGTSGLRGDVNNDGTVNMPDAMFIVNKILNGKFPDE